MTASDITVSFAGRELKLGIRFEETEKYFRLFEAIPTNDSRNIKPISISIEEIEKYMLEFGCTNENAEYAALGLSVGNELTHCESVIFHGVAFIHGDGAYILTAPSGTGKSTQYRNLRKLYGDDYQIINGDKPILTFDSNERIWVYPSPWNGKEGWRGEKSAVLKAIVILSQGKQNILSAAQRDEAVIHLMQQVLFSAPDKESVHTVCRFIDTMVRKIPVYGFVNRGDLISSSMLNSLFQRLEHAENEV